MKSQQQLETPEQTLARLKLEGEAPEWLTLEGLKTLSKGYLVGDETPKMMYQRVAKASAKHCKRPEAEKEFFDIIWKNWLCLSTPVASNLGTERGLPISCFGQYVEDSVDGIFQSYHETAILTKSGGGIGKYWGRVRASGTPIKGNGLSEGIVPWLKVEESVIQSTSQGGVRRGSSAAYLDDIHGDVIDFINLRRPIGDPSRRCLSVNFHHAVNVSDQLMHDAMKGNVKARHIYSELLRARIELGEPYISFIDTANRTAPSSFGGRKIHQSQLCSEIFLPSGPEYTFVCCLSSLNLTRWDEFKDTNAVELSIEFLDGVISEFIEKASGVHGLEKAVRSASEGRTIGLGVIGWHTYLQKNMIAFDSFEAMMHNGAIFKKIKEKADKATRALAERLGGCKWDPTVRNASLLAVAPTTSNSLISGGVSQGIEPIAANIYAQKSAKGTFVRKNPELERLLRAKGKDTPEVWDQINSNRGSVRTLDFLTEEEKAVFQTFREINQFSLVRQAGQRQKYIDQGQSLNLAFAMPADITDTESKERLSKYVHEVHLEAWKLGVKSLYYVRTESVLKGESIFKDASDCKSCEA
jgi:ribonucleoside-diphosphate reductase alpha chain